MRLPGYCVYVLRSRGDHNLYVGFTEDLERRLQAHADGAVRSTAPRRPLQLMYCEHHRVRADAIRREQYLKTSAGKKAIKLMLRESLVQA